MPVIEAIGPRNERRSPAARHVGRSPAGRQYPVLPAPALEAGREAEANVDKIPISSDWLLIFYHFPLEGHLRVP